MHYTLLAFMNNHLKEYRANHLKHNIRVWGGGGELGMLNNNK